MDWVKLAGAALLVGFAALIMARAFAAWRFRRRLRGARLADRRVVSVVAAENANVTCLETDAVNAPALFGWWRPRLLFPPRLVAQLSDEELMLVIQHEQKEVNQLAQKLQDFEERAGTRSLDERAVMLAGEWRAANLEFQRKNTVAQAAETCLKQLQETRANGGDLTALPFIRTQSLVVQLKQQLAFQQIEVAKLSERYRSQGTGEQADVRLEPDDSVFVPERIL